MKVSVGKHREENRYNSMNLCDDRYHTENPGQDANNYFSIAKGGIGNHRFSSSVIQGGRHWSP